jgi:hypothetical protein
LVIVRLGLPPPKLYRCRTIAPLVLPTLCCEVTT